MQGRIPLWGSLSAPMHWTPSWAFDKYLHRMAIGPFVPSCSLSKRCLQFVSRLSQALKVMALG